MHSHGSHKRRRKYLLVLLMLLLPVVTVLSVGTGTVEIPAKTVLSILMDWVGLVHSSASDVLKTIVESIRLPRTLLGILVGGGLAIAGATMQGLFRNPLADPSIIGVAGGAALGASIAMVTGNVWPWMTENAFIHSLTVSLFSFAGGLITTGLVYRMGTTVNGTSVSTMLLAGVAVNVLSGAGVALFTYFADDTGLRALTSWQMGSLSGATWNSVGLLVFVVVPAISLLCQCDKALNALLLGESEAMHLGVSVQKIKMVLIFLCALIVGVSVAVNGIIGFVGLVVPHLIRLFVGPDHHILLPASALLGACLLVLADIAARIVVAPAELPIGIVTAIMGAPFFLSMLWQQRQQMS
ncbi:Hemin transport system permease protein HmuU [invertebrate metagenome]|uniref:Hemin transport system permease protein HmuU n=1 Tax=invertebrate metagenome TaxID=1711999 RepID=A0A2H9TA80_9ZZZZ